MDSDISGHGAQPNLRQTLKQDIKSTDLWSSLRRDYRELEKFYIDDEKKKRLDQMRWFKRFFFLAWWLLKSMLLKLTPIRRILLLIGFFLILGGGSVMYENDQVRTSTNWQIVGGVLFLFVLMLELKDKLLARDELEAGRKVQQALMPDPTPSIAGWSVWLYTRPANEVGGDLVDYLNFGNERHVQVLADVSGKGLQAALLTAKLQATVRALGQDYDSIAKLVSKINEIFHRDSLPNMFASLLYTEVAASGSQVRYVNAGHLPPLLLQSGTIQELPKGEQALGLIGSSAYTEHVVDLRPGDVFFAYSDGLTEARNERGEFYGSERLLRLLPTCQNFSAERIGTTVTADVDWFVGEARANDDLSLIIMKRL